MIDSYYEIELRNRDGLVDRGKPFSNRQSVFSYEVSRKIKGWNALLMTFANALCESVRQPGKRFNRKESTAVGLLLRKEDKR